MKGLLYFLGDYNLFLFGASIIASIVCSYISLDLTSRTHAKLSSRLSWLCSAAVVMGLGIWILHFVGMLSYHQTMSVSYNYGLQAISLFVSVCSSFLFLRFLRVTPLHRFQFMFASVFMGSGISSMHLIGMKAMNLPASIHYIGLLVFSFLIAIIGSSVSLFFARLYLIKGHRWQIYSSFTMAAAIAGMHYTAMQAVHIEPVADPQHSMSFPNLLVGINMAIVLVFIVLLVVSQLDKKKLDESEQHYKSLFDHNFDAVFILDMFGKIVSVNKAAERITGYRMDEFLGSEFAAFIPKSNLIEAQRYFEGFKQGDYQEYQLQIIHKNGHLLDIHATVAPMMANNQIQGFYVIDKDITEQEKAKAELQNSEMKFRSVIETATDAIVITDRDSRIVSWNVGAQKIFGYAEEEMVGSYVDILIPFHLREFHRKDLASVQTNGKIIRNTIDLFGLKKNEEEIPIEVSINSWTAGEDVYFSYFIRDITNRKETERTLFEAESKYRSLVEKSLVGVYIVQNEKFVYTNPRFNSMLGYDSLVGHHISDIIFPEDRPIIEENMHGRLDGRLQDVEYQCRVNTKAGDILHIELFGSRIDYNGRPAVIGNALDITARKASEQLNEFLANHDPLTALPNRRMLGHKLDQAIDVAKVSNQRIAVMYLDLDRFKYINDTLGHTMGDRLLSLVANRMRECLQAKDILARMGGDEFAIMISEVDSSHNVIEVARKILESVRTSLLLDNYELHVSASIGICFYPEDGSTAEELMKNADTALYRAKDQGKDDFSLYTSAMNSETHAAFFLVNDLHKALKEEQFELFYQPRVCGDTGKVISAEALIRWNHPKLGMVPPGNFIPLLEETGLIIPVTEWVLRTVCWQRRAWIDAGFPLVDFSVNFSAQQFMQKDLTKMITEQLTAFNLDTQWLEIEITETSLMKNTDRIREILQQLKGMGIKVAIDDFGTGYSSLAYLKKFNIDTIKIDRSFIYNLQDSRDNEIITAAIINLARSLNMKTVAEGVEMEEQREFLRQHQCDEMQGFLFSRPLPVTQFESFVSRYI
jgi:diguanylate cyclase (GGDEF)-like protein/PAS domain S-box-containing protein